MQRIDNLICVVSNLIKMNLKQEIIYDQTEKIEGEALKITHYTDEKCANRIVVLSIKDIKTINDMRDGITLEYSNLLASNVPYQRVNYRGLVIIKEKLMQLLMNETDISDKELIKEYIDEIEIEQRNYSFYF